MRLKEGLTVRKVGEDYVIVAPEQGMVDLSKVYSLNETAAMLWEELEGKEFSIDDMIEHIRENYDIEHISEEEIKSDMENVVNFFKENGLLVH